MAQRITLYVDQWSSATFTAAFTLRGVPLVPNTLRWSLTDDLGQVVNGRRDVPILPAASVAITLSGADLSTLEPFDNLTRLLTIQGKYSSIDGADLTLAAEYRFGLNRLEGGD